MKRNPILRKEILIGSRSIKFPMGLLFYSGILSAYAFISLHTNIGSYDFNGIMPFNSIANMFIVISILQLMMILIIVPILTASSISGERERQTLDIMLTSPIRPITIVMGKLKIAMLQVFMFLICSIPAMSLSFLYGGIDVRYILIFIAVSICIGFLSGAIGIWCSALYKRTIISVIMSFIIEGILYIGTIAAYIGIYTVKFQGYFAKGILPENIPIGELPLILLFNPGIGFIDTIYNAYYGSSNSWINNIFLDFQISGNPAEIVKRLLPYWSYASLLVTVILGFIFVILAARRIDSVRIREKHMKPPKKRNNKIR